MEDPDVVCILKILPYRIPTQDHELYTSVLGVLKVRDLLYVPSGPFPSHRVRLSENIVSFSKNTRNPNNLQMRSNGSTFLVTLKNLSVGPGENCTWETGTNG